MSLTLSASDRAMLHRTLSLIASPLEAPSASAWRSDVLKSLLPLFRADAGGFVLPHESEPAVTLLNRPAALLDDYLEHQTRDVFMDAWKDLGYGAASVESLTGGRRDAYENSEIYSLVYGPHRVHDSIKCILDLADRAPMVAPGRFFAPRGVPVRGMLALYSERVGTERFGAAGLELMWLLQPLLRAAGQTWKDLASRRRAMATLIDESGDGLAVYDASGRLLHRNRALIRLLAEEPNAAVVEGVAVRSAKALSRLLSRDGHGVTGDGAFERQVDAGRHRYAVRATRAETVFGRSGAILLTVQPLTRRGPSETQIARQFGLTRRESEVAVLLAHGASNKQVTAKLGVTAHTARRHTENVLRKLGVDSRSRVAARLHGAEPESLAG